MAERLKLLAWLAAALGLGALGDPRWLAAAAILIALAAGRRAGRCLRRAAAATLLFAGAVSLAWVMLALRGGAAPAGALLTLNLRAFTLVFLTFVALGRIDLPRAVSFSPELAALAQLIAAQLRLFRRLRHDLQLGVASRTCRRPGPRAGLLIAAAAGGVILRRAEGASRELTEGMIARGFFVDPGDGAES